MEDSAFDRLSLLVHRLRDRTSRRTALRSLAASGVAGGLLRLGIEEGSAACTRRRRRCDTNGECCGRRVICDRLSRVCDRRGDRCCGRRDASCSSRCDCCAGLRCGGGRCGGSSDGGSDLCGGNSCGRGEKCCTVSGVSRCIPETYHCCRSAVCAQTQECCGAGCCSSDWKCCGEGQCCPDDWQCGQTACLATQDAGVSAQAEQSMPFAEPDPFDAKKWASD
jgi:hypothetical protein